MGRVGFLDWPQGREIAGQNVKVECLKAWSRVAEDLDLLVRICIRIRDEERVLDEMMEGLRPWEKKALLMRWNR